VVTSGQPSWAGKFDVERPDAADDVEPRRLEGSRLQSATTIDGEVVASANTLRFREHHEVEQDIDRQGFEMVDVRDAPDRPGKELVFIGRRVGLA
jgi:hypothetical protein